jgi:type II secretory pathway component PulF
VALAFQESRIFPQAVKLMISTGEASGALDRVMSRLSEHYREELETDIRRLSTMIEPILLVLMGVMVGSVAVSFILPLIKLSRGVH